MVVGRRDNRTDYWGSKHSTRSRNGGAYWTPVVHNKPADSTLSDNQASNKARGDMWQPVFKEGARVPLSNSWLPTLRHDVGALPSHKVTWQPTLKQYSAESQTHEEAQQPTPKENAHQRTAAGEEMLANCPRELQDECDSEPLLDATSGGSTEDSASTGDSKNMQYECDSEPLIDVTSGGSIEDSASSVSSNASTGEPTTIADVEEAELPRTESGGSENMLLGKLDWADYSSDEDGFIPKRKPDVGKTLIAASQRTTKSQRSNDALEFYDSLREMREALMDKQESGSIGQGQRNRSKKKERDSALKASLEKHFAKCSPEPTLEPTIEEYEATSKGLASIFRTFEEFEDEEDQDKGIDSEEAKNEKDSLIHAESMDVIQESREEEEEEEEEEDDAIGCLLAPSALRLEQIIPALPSAPAKVTTTSPHREALSKRGRILAMFAVVVVGMQMALVFSDATIPIYPLAVLVWWAFCGVIMKPKAVKQFGDSKPKK